MTKRPTRTAETDDDTEYIVRSRHLVACEDLRRRKLALIASLHVKIMCTQQTSMPAAIVTILESCPVTDVVTAEFTCVFSQIFLGIGAALLDWRKEAGLTWVHQTVARLMKKAWAQPSTKTKMKSAYHSRFVGAEIGPQM
jgi:hypothetical protein